MGLEQCFQVGAVRLLVLRARQQGVERLCTMPAITRRRASAIAYRIAQPLRRTPCGARTLHRRLPHRGRFLRHGAQSLRPPAAARARPAGGPRPEPGNVLETHGFDRVQHEQIQTDLRSGRIGLAQNRLPVTSHIEDAVPDELDPRHRTLGMQALAEGRVAVVTLAGGVGSRWTKGRARSRRSTRSASWAAGTATSSRRTWPRACASAASAARCCRTSSRPAT